MVLLNIFIMENNFLSILSVILSVFFMLKVVKRFKSNSSSTSNLPPGPWKLPIIGSIHHLMGGLPHHRMRELSQKYGPLMHLQLGETSTIVVSSPQVAKEVLKTNDVTFAHRPPLIGAEIVTYGCTNISFSPYGDYWRQLRKMCTLGLLSAKRVRSFQAIREEEVSNLIRYVSLNIGSSINLSDIISSMAYRIVSRATFGDICKDQEAYILFIKKVLKSNELFGVSGLFPSQNWLHVITGTIHRLKEMHRTGDTLLDNIINEATAKSRENGSLLSILLDLKDNDHVPEFHLTINNIKAVIQDLYIGGTDTTSTTLEWALSEMLKNPKVLKRAQAEVRQVFGSKGYVEETTIQELKYLKAVIQETLRLHPPAPLLLPRLCGETCNISGYTIPVGTQVIINAWALGRVPEYWNEGDKFYPERFLDSPIDYQGSHFEFIPFGAGKRICPGLVFSMPNIQLPLAQLLYYFDWKLPSGICPETFDMTEAFGATVTRKDNLFAIPVLVD